VPNELCARLHNRMPVVLKPDVWPQWLGEEPADVPHLKALLNPYPSGDMIYSPVSARVRMVEASHFREAITLTSGEFPPTCE
jgi:putative SOS response-associated peptidase YedK